MPYQSMSLEEFARFVGMDPRKVEREADKGLLPGRKVGGNWRFNRRQVHDWLENRMMEMDESSLSALDRGTALSRDSETLAVTSLIGVESIDLQLRASTKTSVLRELVELANGTGLVYDQAELFQALREREALGSTALPNGLAIPHPHQPMPYATAEPLICLARSINPVAFSAPDGRMTQLFFLICSHDSTGHLHVLARLMRMLDGPITESLLAVETPTDALELLIGREKLVANKAR
jgi:PTS system nitrogen regulatory IIA component